MLRIKKILLLLILLIANVGFLLAQPSDILFQRISIEQNLSHSQILSILQDDEGYLWIGTHDGLNQYDGYNFLIYKNKKSNDKSISDNIIFDIIQDREGFLWIGTNNGGLNKLDKSTGEFTHYLHHDSDKQSIASNTINCILETESGKIWAGTDRNGISILDKKSQTFVHLRHDPQNKNSLSCNTINAMVQTADGKIWIATSTKGLDCYDPKTKRISHYERQTNTESDKLLNHINTIFIEQNNGLLYLGTQTGLSVFDPKTKLFEDITDSTTNESNKIIVTDIIKDTDNKLWVASNKGLFVYNYKTDNYTKYSNNPKNKYSLSENNLSVLLQDQSGIIWIGTFEKGLNKFDYESQKFRYYGYENSLLADIPHNTVRSIYEDSFGVLWLGLVDGGLAKFDRKNNQIEKFLVHQTVTAIAEDSAGNLWIGSWREGVSKLQFDNKTAARKIIQRTQYAESVQTESLSSNTVHAILIDSKERIWIGTGNGLELFSAQKNGFVHFRSRADNPNSLSDMSVQCIEEGTTPYCLWIGTWNGLNKLELPTSFDELLKNHPRPLRFVAITHFFSSKTDTNKLSDNRIISISKGENGILWVGTFAGGLNKFDLKTEHIQSFTEENGLPNNVIYGVFSDKNMHVWASTNKGIFQLNPQTEQIINYDQSHGLQSNEFFWGAAFQNNSGEIFFGGANGLNSFFPLNFKQNEYLSPIVLTNIQINNAKNQSRKIFKQNKITLFADDKSISFEFAALHFSDPKKIKYLYKLDGFDNDWIETDASKRFANYTNLDPGMYTFRVKGTNSDGLWSNKEIMTEITVMPTIWETLWFRTLGVFIAITMLWSVFKIRTQIIVRQKIELEKMVKTRTAEVKKQNNEIKQQHAHIKASINYAQTIQQAILPSKTVLNKHFEHFVFFKPKDIVSGDFYWTSETADKQTVFIAVVDCTGHGVPGAFMSMIGSRLLSLIVNERQIHDPKRILEHLNAAVKKTLKQDESNNNDGMDLAFCKIEKTGEHSRTVTFTGAKLPLFHYQKSSGKVIRYRGDRKSVGGIKKRNAIAFTNQIVEIQKGDQLFLSSDGIIDQNNVERERFGTVRFVDLLNKTIFLDIGTQRKFIDDAIADFQGDAMQRDDISMIGIQF